MPLEIEQSPALDKLDKVSKHTLFAFLTPLLTAALFGIIGWMFQDIKSTIDKNADAAALADRQLSERVAGLKTVVTELRIDVAGTSGADKQHFADLDTRVTRLEDRGDGHGPEALRRHQLSLPGAPSLSVPIDYLP